MMTEFKIQRSWLARKGSSEIDATLCRLKITLSERNITEYSGEHEPDGDHLEVPAFFLAEWIAENWWSLLWEPRKSEDASDDADFLARHSILTAQHGFALPKIIIVPHGRSIHVTAISRNVQFADIRFRNGGSACLPRQDVEYELKRFVGGAITRLKDCAIDGTSLQEAWNLVESTAEDEIQFCQFVGALGLSPYAADDRVECVLDRALSNIGPRLTMDLCLASTPESIESGARTAELAHATTNAAPMSTLEPLATIPLPAENYSVPAYRRGVQAAKRARSKLGIKETDPRGANLLFEKLKIDPTRKVQNADSGVSISIVGAVARESLSAQVALLQPMEIQRRFAAARAAYTA